LYGSSACSRWRWFLARTSGGLESRQRFLLANALQVSGVSLGQIVPVILAVIVSPALAIVIPPP
jgi:hypothetical protein